MEETGPPDIGARETAPPRDHDAAPGHELPPLPDAKSLVATCISLLTGKAWEAMGLMPNPETKKVERNLGDAQLAIDAASALADLMRPHLSEVDRREVEVLVTNLRLNFVEQKSKQT